MLLRNALLTVAGVCALTSLCGCSTTPQYGSLQPALDQFDAFELPLGVNEQGVATVTVESSAGPLELILDTGADQGILLRADASVISDLQRDGSQFHFTADGQLTRAPVYRIDELRLGPLRYTDVRAPMDDTAFPEFMGGQGMLGRGLLQQCTLDINLPEARLGIHPAGALPDDFAQHDWITVKLLDISDGPVVGVRLDESERTLRMVLDSGAIATGPDGLYGTVELPADLRSKQITIDKWPGYCAEAVHVGDGTLGPMCFYIIDHPQPPGTHGFLGNVLYAQRRVVIAPGRNRVYISKSAQ